ncbi:Exo 5'-3' exonuclease (including N-terminal domain of PolI) [uncultured Caudovirales phage]|uniref:Exo 5'-3' exonuclease (Including N-terminal domain of PolI) n=1 Tax=uncultured Caudovirales phage TaxID=2100421 RepID=A0A6J5LJZ0_9CAUD|nr:Exo 5'-3' exonuclease (including N-terminal domain of PolI) [uncultured Caudovirales phage]
MRYLIVDTANTFFRARHSASRQSDTWDKLGFAIHLTLSSVAKCWREQKADHVVFCLEGRSWRKDVYEPYKKNRAVARAALTEKEQEEDKMFWETFDDLRNFLVTKTNCTILQHEELEADDLIAGFIQAHPNDHHTIVSSDTDFHQLLSENVNQYNGVADELHSLEGIFDGTGKPVIDKKTKLPKKIQDPKWILFEKCIRGDTSDNIFSAYPGVRTKGSKNKVGLTEAFEDRDKKGYNWNNLMLQRWTDHNGVEHRVIDDYERNCILVDLTAQPDHIKEKIAVTIANGAVKKTRPMVGAQFLKFCGKYDLVKLSDHATQYSEVLGSEYPK